MPVAKDPSLSTYDSESSRPQLAVVIPGPTGYKSVDKKSKNSDGYKLKLRFSLLECRPVVP